MKGVILAAGIASRLRPLTEHTPKCLLEIGGRNLLERTIDGLIQNEIRELVIVTGYLQEQIIAFVQQKYPELPVQFIYNRDYAITNNIYSLYLSRQGIRPGEDILLLDSDILFDPQLVAAVLQAKSDNSLALNIHPLSEEEMKVIPDAAGYVKEISKTCSIEKALGESIGIEKISASYLSNLFEELERMICQEQLSHLFYEAAFERLIARNQTFEIIDVTSWFSMELDTVEDFQTATTKIPAHLL